ncbi:hypothetical protein OSB04_002761 [Centaurea solstitialis]|uniref:non-specific serine/threonine protein kinase n=1 Tax=Centaurea solstitialis TaxID=347529 RepID=A0AA38WTD9_9ASTR|nr:hypothetical protein OSB04_002761 [Centaurea solstitialis]
MDEKGSLLSNYRLGKTLGIGAFGKVKAAQHKLTSLKVAIKILALQSIHHDSAAQKVRREINIMRLLSHPHIVSLYEVIETPSAICMVMEYMNSGELFDYITENGRLHEDQARHFFQQVSIYRPMHHIYHYLQRGTFIYNLMKDYFCVESCHLHMVVHRDLKPENLLLDSKGNVKIADFGLANLMRDGYLLKTSCGSPNYASPEVISGSLYAGPEVDVWSCGVVLYALLCGSLPFDDESLSGLYAKIKSGIYTYPNYLSVGARDLITRMLIVDPVNRISIPEIYKHPWFQHHLPQYISINASWSAGKVDAQVLKEMGSIGFNVQQVIGSLNNLLHNQATVTYSILLHKHLSNHKDNNLLESLPAECMMDRRDVYVRPICGVESRSKWVLGLKSRASPHETMRDVLSILTSLNVRWKKIGLYNIKCIWKPQLQTYSMPMGISLTEDCNKKSSNFSSYDAVKFEIQLYRATTTESYLLDWQRIYGPPFLFIELCAGFRTYVI